MKTATINLPAPLAYSQIFDPAAQIWFRLRSFIFDQYGIDLTVLFDHSSSLHSGEVNRLNVTFCINCATPEDQTAEEEKEFFEQLSKIFETKFNEIFGLFEDLVVTFTRDPLGIKIYNDHIKLYGLDSEESRDWCDRFIKDYTNRYIDSCERLLKKNRKKKNK